MVQENRAFDNYFGVLAQYRVNHQPPIPGAQLSDVNDLHTLPPDHTMKAIPEFLYPLLGGARLSGVHTKAAKKARL